MEDEIQRYFFAINIPEEATPALKLVQDHLPKEGARYSFSNFFHVTLKFLGELDEVKVMEAKLKAQGLTRQMTFSEDDLEIRFNGVGVFRKEQEPRVVWAGVKISDKILDFQRNLEEALEAVGFPMERKRFKPHITLARVHDVERSTSQDISDEFKKLGVKREAFKVSSFYLMRSHLKRHQPAQYEVIEQFDF